MSPSARGWRTFIAIGVVSLAADLTTKSAIFAALGMPGMGGRIELVPRFLAFETNLNEGALFGMGQGMGMLFAGISVAALAGILAMVARPATRASSWLVVALALICGGILGNLYDRLGIPGLAWHAPAARVGDHVYAVRDWIHVTVPGVIDWPIFNLADSWLVIGAGMILLASLRNPPPESHKAPDAASPAP